MLYTNGEGRDDGGKANSLCCTDKSRQCIPSWGLVEYTENEQSTQSPIGRLRESRN